MLKKKKQYKYITKRCDNMVMCVNNFCANKDHEELHKLRVEIKKLKAYASFVSKLTDDKLKKTLEPLDEIFRMAGEIRTVHLNLESIQKYRVHAPGLKKEQKALGENVSEQLSVSSQRYIHNIKTACSSIRSLCEDIMNKKICRLYSKKIDSLSSFFGQHFDEKKLHSRRKIIKMLLYTENFLPKKIRRELALNTSYMDILQDVAGKWHDAIIAIELLESSPYAGKEKPERLLHDKDGLLQAVKLLATHFEKNISLKKTIYAGP